MSEVYGLVKNGLDRGWPATEVVQSLINAGFNPQEVQMELGKFRVAPQQNTLPQVEPAVPQQLSNYQTKSTPSTSSPGTLKWVLISMLILALLAVLGAVWYLFLKT